MPRWAYVIVIPEDTSIIVFHKGKLKGSNKFNDWGGQSKPK